MELWTVVLFLMIVSMGMIIVFRLSQDKTNNPWRLPMVLVSSVMIIVLIGYISLMYIFESPIKNEVILEPAETSFVERITPLDVLKTPKAKPENYDFPLVEVPSLCPDILDIRQESYGEMPVFHTQNEVTKYILHQLLNHQFENEFYLAKDLAVDEGTGYVILEKACEAAMTYYLFSAYDVIDLYTEDWYEDKMYAKMKIIYIKPEYDLEARAEAMEFIAKNPLPSEGFQDFETEKAYAKKIHDFIARKVTYSSIGDDSEAMLVLENYEAFQEAYNVLAEEENTAVCAGYARGFALIAHYAGINTAWVFGNETDMESHAWNIIYPCDGSEAVLVDVTWDDTESVDIIGQMEVSDRLFYSPLSEEFEHRVADHFEEFLSFINRSVK